MTKIILIHIFLLLSLFDFGQDTTVTIYFKSGQSQLTLTQQKTIDKLHTKAVTKITVDGYADTVGKASFNKKLSYKRALTTAKTIKTENKNITGKGESKDKRASLNTMRKVVVNVWYDKPIIETKTIEEKKEPIVFVDPCTDDTTIFSEAGTMIKINKCYYKKIKHCFKYKEYLDARSVQQSGLRTIDEKGNPIESGGMIDISFCSDTCVKNPIIIFLPVPVCLSQQPMTLWTLTRNNTWRNSSNKIEIVKINGKEFYKLMIYCPGRINCDRPKPNKRKIKVKVKNGLKIKSATLSYNCPLYSVNGKIKKKKKVATFPYNCPKDDPLIKLKVYSKNGDTLIIDNKNINQYKRKQKIRSACNCDKKPKEKFLGIFKIRQKYLYKKYKIYKKDFDISNDNK